MLLICDFRRRVQNTKFSAADWGIDLEALTKQIEEEASKEQPIEEE